MAAKESQPEVGSSFYCKSCERQSVVKRDRKMDGWTCVGEFLVCALCSAQLGELKTDVGRSSDEAGREAVNDLANFFGETVEKGPTLEAEEDSRFCRDCVHYYSNPFASRCMLHEKSVEPMHDCADFSPRPAGMDPTESEEATES